MSIYAAKARAAYLKLLAKGAAATFTHTSPGTLDPATNLHSAPATTTVAGAAVGLEANMREYERLSLVPSDSRTLLWAPATFGETPLLDSQVVWGGATYTLRSFNPFGADGTSILFTAVVSK